MELKYKYVKNQTPDVPKMLHDNNLDNPILLKLDVNKYKINFNVNPKKKVLSFLAKEMKVLSFDKLSFFGSFQQNSLSRWQLNASLNFYVMQECVVTLEPVTSFIKSNVKRVYTKDLPPINEKTTESDLSKAEYEKFEETLNLMDILLEELSLNTPEYPKVENISKIRKKNEKNMDDQGKYPETPFKILKDLNKKNKID